MPFALPGLFKITALASAQRAVEEIVLQGEGAPAHSEGSHFARFAAIKEELVGMRAARPAFEPARPVVRNPIMSDLGLRHDGVRIVDPVTARVVDLGIAIYALMIRTLSQVFAPAPLPRDLRLELAVAATPLMSTMARVAEVATRLPANPALPGATAAPNFELPGSSGQLVQQCAARILGERAAELASAARKLDAGVPLRGIAGELDALAQRLDRLHLRFEKQLGPAVDQVAPPKAAQAPTDPPVPIPQAPRAARSDDYVPEVVRTKDLTLHFDGQRCIHSRHCVLEAPTVFLANTKGAWLHPETVPVEHCVRVAHNCPSGAIRYERHDGGPQETAPEVNVLRVRENGPYAVNAQVDIDGKAALRATLCRCGRSRRKPYCDNSHRSEPFVASGEPETIASEPLAERGGPLTITPVLNGPLQLRGSVEICSGTGRAVLRTESARLCRCGGSANKPFCDNTHARIGFRSDD